MAPSSLGSLGPTTEFMRSDDPWRHDGVGRHITSSPLDVAIPSVSTNGNLGAGRPDVRLLPANRPIEYVAPALTESRLTTRDDAILVPVASRPEEGVCQFGLHERPGSAGLLRALSLDEFGVDQGIEGLRRLALPEPSSFGRVQGSTTSRFVDSGLWSVK